jgi:hypothetical protein
MMIVCCSCDEHYGGDALACAKSIAAGTAVPCACDCHRAEPLPSREDVARLTARVAELSAERDKLQAFKDWVHNYLDTHGVPHHPPGPHGAEGCRIGDRMDWLMSRLAADESTRQPTPEEAEEPPTPEEEAAHDAFLAECKRLNDRNKLAAQQPPAPAGEGK